VDTLTIERTRRACQELNNESRDSLLSGANHNEMSIPNVWTIHENRRTRMGYVVMNRERVQELCEEKGMTRRALAAEAGISVETARNVEREVPVTFRTGHAIADALGVEPSPSLGRVL
jgi:lambda repressor-like predicted transcriptional regulator